MYWARPALLLSVYSIIIFHFHSTEFVFPFVYAIGPLPCSAMLHTLLLWEQNSTLPTCLVNMGSTVKFYPDVLVCALHADVFRSPSSCLCAPLDASQNKCYK